MVWYMDSLNILLNLFLSGGVNNNNIFKILNYNNSFLEYLKVINFYKLTVNLVTLIYWHIHSRRFCMCVNYFLIFNVENHICKKNDNFFLSLKFVSILFPFLVYCTSCRCYKGIVRENILAFFPNVRGKTYCLSPLIMMLTVDFSWTISMEMRKLLSLPSLLRIFLSWMGDRFFQMLSVFQLMRPCDFFYLAYWCCRLHRKIFQCWTRLTYLK